MRLRSDGLRFPVWLRRNGFRFSVMPRLGVCVIMLMFILSASSGRMSSLFFLQRAEPAGSGNCTDSGIHRPPFGTGWGWAMDLLISHVLPSRYKDVAGFRGDRFSESKTGPHSRSSSDLARATALACAVSPPIEAPRLQCTPAGVRPYRRKRGKPGGTGGWLRGENCGACTKPSGAGSRDATRNSPLQEKVRHSTYCARMCFRAQDVRSTVGMALVRASIASRMPVFVYWHKACRERSDVPPPDVCVMFLFSVLCFPPMIV